MGNVAPVLNLRGPNTGLSGPKDLTWMVWAVATMMANMDQIGERHPGEDIQPAGPLLAGRLVWVLVAKRYRLLNQLRSHLPVGVESF